MNIFLKSGFIFLHTNYETLYEIYKINFRITIFIIFTLLLIHIFYNEKLIRKYRVKRIIKNNELYCVYQPIVNLKTGLIYGYESLARTHSSKYKSIQSFIYDVYELNFVEEFIFTTLKNAIHGFEKLEKNNYLFVNMDTKILLEKFCILYNVLESLDLELRNHLVLELTEYNSGKDMGMLKQSIEKIRNLGIKIAIDDYGVGYSNIDLRMSITPDFIKTDMQFTRDIDKIDDKKELIKRMVEFHKYSQIITICEGIETKEELDTLIEIGVNFGQGYYLGKPAKIDNYI